MKPPGPAPLLLYIGIDGGATRARAVVTDAAGTVLTRRAGGAAIVRPEDPSAAARSVIALARAALDEVSPGAPAAGLCCALAGAGPAEQQRAVTERIRSAGLAPRVIVVTDAHAALHDAFGDRAGILLVAGTGSVAWARGVDGRLARAGGWGHLLGDEGSGYAVGLAALRSVARAEDGREPPAPLHTQLLRHTGSAAAADLVGWVARAAKADVAALAALVSSEAEHGDERARALIGEAADALLELARAVHARLEPWAGPAQIAVTGGLARAGGPLRTRLAAALAADARRFVVHTTEVDAARGAAALARRTGA